jgi:hypothetical protein
MRTLLLLAALAGAAAADDDFAIDPPDSLDWQVHDVPEKGTLRAHFTTDGASIAVIVTPLSANDAACGLEALAKKRRESIEQPLDETAKREARDAELGGKPARSHDVRGVHAGAPLRITWTIARRGAKQYVVQVQRAGAAVDHADVAAEIAACVASFRFLGPEPAAPDAAKPEAPAPEAAPEPREILTFEFWKLRCVKPEGFARIEPPDPTEAAHGVILKLLAKGDQRLCMIRVYVARRGTARCDPLDTIVRKLVAAFEARFPEDKREEPAIGRTWEIPLVAEARTVRLVGHEKVQITSLWYLASCTTGTQYRVEIILSGATAERAWAPQLDDFLKHFEPLR